MASTAEPKKIVLASSLDLTAAAPLRDEISTARGCAIDMDASKVEHLGAQCLQVILAASCTWKNEGHDFNLTDVSIFTTEALENFGVQSELLFNLEMT